MTDDLVKRLLDGTISLPSALQRMGEAVVHRRVKKICETWIRNGQFEVQKVKAKHKGGEVPLVFVKEDADG